MLYRFGRFELDRRSYELRRDGVALRVEPKVLDLLLYLAGNPDRLLSKQELLDSVWPGTAVSEGSLTRAISLARSAIRCGSDAPATIEAVSGRGYRFRARVEIDEGAEAAPTKQPRLQYAKTSDGASIAWASLGEGKPLLLMPPWPLSWLAGWTTLGSIVWSSLSRRSRLFVYDARGCGFSDRNAVDFSMDAMLGDLDAAAGVIGPEPFALLATTNAVPVAVAYAAEHAERVSHLILVDGYAAFADWSEAPVAKLEVSLRDKDWELFSETHARIFWGIQNPKLATRFAEWIRASCSPDAYRACYAALESYDASRLFGRVTAPALVIHNRGNRWVRASVGQRIAASIPGSRLLLVDDIEYTGLAAAIGDFIAEAGS